MEIKVQPRIPRKARSGGENQKSRVKMMLILFIKNLGEVKHKDKYTIPNLGCGQE
jgi:hypothetical protein